MGELDDQSMGRLIVAFGVGLPLAALYVCFRMWCMNQLCGDDERSSRRPVTAIPRPVNTSASGVAPFPQTTCGSGVAPSPYPANMYAGGMAPVPSPYNNGYPVTTAPPSYQASYP